MRMTKKEEKELGRYCEQVFQDLLEEERMLEFKGYITKFLMAGLVKMGVCEEGVRIG